MGIPRLKDPELLQKIREMPCFVCGSEPPNDPAHITTKKLVGDDPRYLIPLCRECHSEQHLVGIITFAETYKLPINTEAIYPHLTFEWDL